MVKLIKMDFWREIATGIHGTIISTQINLAVRYPSGRLLDAKIYNR